MKKVSGCRGTPSAATPMFSSALVNPELNSGARFVLWTALFLSATFALTAKAETAFPLRIAAASDLRFALGPVVDSYNEKSKSEHSETPSSRKIEITYGASGTFTQQILNGAPFDLFLAADLEYPKKLASAGKGQGPIETYASGQLVLWITRGKLALLPKELTRNSSSSQISNLDFLRHADFVHIAVANPVHAPYGLLALKALQASGVYNSIKNKMVIGESVSQAAEFATSGSVEAALISRSLAESPELKNTGETFLISQKLAEPLLQGGLVLEQGHQAAAAKSFLAFLCSSKGQAILIKNGLLGAVVPKAELSR